jgi:dihydropteroate synthase type 2
VSLTRVLGIVNITRDSFSDGGRYLRADAAIAHARALMKAGAAMIDLGPASSHPDAETVSAEEEIARLVPVVSALREDGTPISIDSYHHQTHSWAASQGVSALNDIQGFPHPEAYAALAEAECDLIVMHSIQRLGKATRVMTDPEEIWEEVVTFFDGRVAALEDAGVSRGRLILDPGMGFFLGSDPECSLSVLRRLGVLKERYGLPVLVSVSRKSFLRAIAGVSVAQAGPVTLAAELFAAHNGADWIRTHDVGALVAALSIRSALG